MCAQRPSSPAGEIALAGSWRLRSTHTPPPPSPAPGWSLGQSLIQFFSSLSFRYVCARSQKYYDDTSHVLIAMMIRAIRPELLSKAGFHELSQPLEFIRATVAGADGASPVIESRGEELRCMVAVLRHGDRTAKQKLKFVTKHRLVLELITQHTRQ